MTATHIFDIIKQVCAAGSYGLHTARSYGGLINAWHVNIDGRRLGTYPSRREAREAALWTLR